MTDQSTRLPYWLGAAVREAARRSCEQAVATAPAADVPHLRELLIELGVAAARDTAWPASSQAVRRAAGWGADVVPVRMSAEETTALLRYADDPAILTALFGPARTSQR